MVEVFIHDYDHQSRSGAKYIMATVTPEEALGIIISLSEQLRQRSPNAGRAEQHCLIKGDITASGFLSIGVMSMEERAAADALLKDARTKKR